MAYEYKICPLRMWQQKTDLPCLGDECAWWSLAGAAKHLEDEYCASRSEQPYTVAKVYQCALKSLAEK